MKRLIMIFFLAFCFLCGMFADSHALQIDMKLEDIWSIYGKPQKKYTAEEFPKHEWDLICYHYDYFDIYAYRNQKTVHSVKIYTDKYLALVENNYLYCGKTKTEIEELFGIGYYEGDTEAGKMKYYYSLKDFKELYCEYNKENILESFYFGYVNPE